MLSSLLEICSGKEQELSQLPNSDILQELKILRNPNSWLQWSDKLITRDRGRKVVWRSSLLWSCSNCHSVLARGILQLRQLIRIQKIWVLLNFTFSAQKFLLVGRDLPYNNYDVAPEKKIPFHSKLLYRVRVCPPKTPTISRDVNGHKRSSKEPR